MSTARIFACRILGLLLVALPSTSAFECSRTEVTVEAVEECVNAVRADPQAYAWSYPCPTWRLKAVDTLDNNKQLGVAARIHTSDMVTNDFFEHRGSDGSEFNDRIWATGYPGNTIGENLAVGYTDALSVVGGWMCSDTHRANLLTCAFDEVGTHVDCSSGRCYVAQEYGCGGSCCNSIGDTGSSLSLGGGFFSRLSQLREGNSAGNGCRGIMDCILQQVFG